MNVSWKTWLWRTLITAAIVTLIAACFYAEENSRGVNAWKKCEQQLAARGESVTWTNYFPTPVPDDQNFYKAPMMTEWFVRSPTNYLKISIASLSTNRDTQSDTITEMSASNYLAWSDGFAVQFDQIRDAVKRPTAYIDGYYQHPFQSSSLSYPNFVSYRAVSQVLVHRAKCHLLLGEPDQALADLTLLHDLNRTLDNSNQPAILVTIMMHVAISGIYVDAIACGIDSHSWREPDLSALQKQLAEISLLSAVGESFRYTRNASCHMLDTASVNELIATTGVKTNTASDLGSWFVPSGWIYQNKAVIATLETGIIEAMDYTNLTVSPAKAKANNRRTEDEFRHITPWNFVAARSIPNFTKAVEAMARNQTWVDQAQIACALERYRLANGKYPTTLAPLAPQFLDKIPHDIINGKPMVYTFIDEQNFKLYSIGWNEVDEGGMTAHDSAGKEDRDNGDWVWHYPM